MRDGGPARNVDSLPAEGLFRFTLSRADNFGGRREASLQGSCFAPSKDSRPAPGRPPLRRACVPHVPSRCQALL